MGIAISQSRVFFLNLSRCCQPSDLFIVLIFVLPIDNRERYISLARWYTDSPAGVSTTGRPIYRLLFSFIFSFLSPHCTRPRVACDGPRPDKLFFIFFSFSLLFSFFFFFFLLVPVFILFSSFHFSFFLFHFFFFVSFFKNEHILNLNHFSKMNKILNLNLFLKMNIFKYEHFSYINHFQK